MRKALSHLTACLLTLMLFGCSDGGCTKKVNVGSAGSTWTYTDADGQSHQITSDADGNIDVPCDVDTSAIKPPEMLV